LGRRSPLREKPVRTVYVCNFDYTSRVAALKKAAEVLLSASAAGASHSRRGPLI
jgi:hypothetical protein